MTEEKEPNRKKHSKSEKGVAARILAERGEHEPSLNKRSAAILAERLNNSRSGHYLD